MKSRFVQSFVAVVAVMGLLSIFGTHALRAENESPVQLSGTVKDSTGKLVAGVNVKLYKIVNNSGQEIGGRGSGGGGGKRDAFGSPDVIEMQGNKFGQLVGTVQTDQNGVYTFKTVKPGRYRYQCGNPRVTGYSGGNIDVPAGQNMTFDITLLPPAK